MKNKTELDINFVITNDQSSCEMWNSMEVVMCSFVKLQESNQFGL